MVTAQSLVSYPYSLAGPPSEYSEAPQLKGWEKLGAVLQLLEVEVSIIIAGQGLQITSHLMRRDFWAAPRAPKAAELGSHSITELLEEHCFDQCCVTGTSGLWTDFAWVTCFDSRDCCPGFENVKDQFRWFSWARPFSIQAQCHSM